MYILTKNTSFLKSVYQDSWLEEESRNESIYNIYHACDLCEIQMGSECSLAAMSVKC
jgi:hypothetical protein